MVRKIIFIRERRITRIISEYPKPASLFLLKKNMGQQEKMPITPGRSFAELEVWKKMRVLKKEIENVVKTFPDCEKYCLTYQLRKVPDR